MNSGKVMAIVLATAVVCRASDPPATHDAAGTFCPPDQVSPWNADSLRLVSSGTDQPVAECVSIETWPTAGNGDWTVAFPALSTMANSAACDASRLACGTARANGGTTCVTCGTASGSLGISTIATLVCMGLMVLWSLTWGRRAAPTPSDHFHDIQPPSA